MSVSTIVVTALSVVLLIGQVPAADYSARTHFYTIEYLKPNSGTRDISVLNIVFNRKLDAASAERILREEIQRATSLFPPKGDVMAYAWTETDPMPGSEKMITLSDGSTFLIYSPKTKQVQTEKQYDTARVKAPEAGKCLKVEISVELERGGDGRARVLGKTNLPHGMQLMLDVRGTGSKYFAQDSVEVVNGRIVSDWFGDRDKPLRLGTYEITVSSPLPDLQPPGVRAVIGHSGENLLGPVRTSLGSKMVELTVKKKLP